MEGPGLTWPWRAGGLWDVPGSAGIWENRGQARGGGDLQGWEAA